MILVLVKELKTIDLTVLLICNRFTGAPKVLSTNNGETNEDAEEDEVNVILIVGAAVPDLIVEDKI